jgi:transposase-like protein
MNRGVGAAVRPLPESNRKDLAVQVLAGSQAVSDLAARHGVSRKFVYQQTHKARVALDEAFSSATPDEAVLFELAVTGVRHGSMRQPAAVEITATGDRTHGSDPQQRARGGAGVRPDR